MFKHKPKFCSLTRPRMVWFSVLLLMTIFAAPIAEAQGPFSTAAINISAAGTTKVITGTAAKVTTVYGGGVTLNTGSSTAQTLQFVYGTGTNCGTGTTVITGTLSPGTATYIPLGQAVNGSFSAPAGQDVCAVTSATANAGGWLYYAQN